MRILIIDDSKAMRGFLDALATELSFTTVLAEDGRDGLNKLLKNDPSNPFDLVLVDWDMPVMTGIEFVQLVRRNHDFDALKIMMVTTNNTEAKVTLALASGANDSLMKPVSKESLEEKLLILGVIN
jgi:two-component system chemotaxis response regulator CheY